MAVKLEMLTHRSVLKVDVGFVMAVFGGDAVQPFDFDINAFVLLELIVVLQPARVLEQRIGLGTRGGNFLVGAGESQFGFDLGQRVHVSVLLRVGKGTAAIASRQQ
ncbi:hypothetical protein D9M71_705310 [compost metagenome]